MSNETKDSMRLGFIHPIMSLLVSVLYYLNSAELVKWLAARIYQRCRKTELTIDETISAKNIGIDLHIVLKWLIVITFLSLGFTQSWAFYLTCYLIAGNLFTYFYYHVWGSGFARAVDLNTKRRRYLTFILSVGFYLVAYAYLYQFHLNAAFNWPNDTTDFANALYGSICTAFTLTHGDFTPTTITTRTAVLTELANTFAFFSIILADAIPNLNNEE